MATSNVELGAGDSIGHTVQILLDCKKKGRALRNQHPPSIRMVPKHYRDLSPRSFNPSVVSIGPLHRQDKSLQGFEAQKMIYLHNLLDRSSFNPEESSGSNPEETSGSNPEETLEECVQKVSGKIKLIRACYQDSTAYNDVELATMMVIDGCFIHYFIHLLSGEDGPFVGDYMIASKVVADLVIIENQIPFFVIADIFESTIKKFKPNISLTSHMIILFKFYNLFRVDLECSIISRDTNHDHIVGLLHTSLQLVHNQHVISAIPKPHSAMELDRAGVNFRHFQDPTWAMEMKLELPWFSCFPWLWYKPTLRMPKLHVYDSTERYLRNLIIYEQSSPVFEYVTSYVVAMDMLIDTTEDVAKLVKSGVLDNRLGSNEAVVDMINNITTEVTIGRFLYQKEWQQLDTYYNSYWPKAVANLKRTYFNSPWNVIALFAGLVLFVLTVVQTIFTIKAANPITKQ